MGGDSHIAPSEVDKTRRFGLRVFFCLCYNYALNA